MTKWHDDKNKWRMNADTPIPIGDEWNRDPNPSYICNYCQRTMSKLTDRSGLSPSWYCTNCSIEVDPSITEVRSKSPLSTRDEPPEHPYVAFPPEPELKRKKKEIKGGLKAMTEKGSIRVTSYKEGKG
jgi:hypothetical protein